MARTTIGEQLYQPEGTPDDFQADLEREERRRNERPAHLLLTTGLGGMGSNQQGRVDTRLVGVRGVKTGNKGKKETRR